MLQGFFFFIPDSFRSSCHCGWPRKQRCLVFELQLKKSQMGIFFLSSGQPQRLLPIPLPQLGIQRHSSFLVDKPTFPNTRNLSQDRSVAQTKQAKTADGFFELCPQTRLYLAGSANPGPAAKSFMSLANLTGPNPDTPGKRDEMSASIMALEFPMADGSLASTKRHTESKDRAHAVSAAVGRLFY